MPRYIVERVIPGSGAYTASTLQRIARESRKALYEMGPHIQWIESYVTADKWFCVYIAPDEKTVYEHAKRGGFPADAVWEVMAVVDPVSAEGGFHES